VHAWGQLSLESKDFQAKNRVGGLTRFAVDDKSGERKREDILFKRTRAISIS